MEDLLRAAPAEPATGTSARLRRPWWSRLSRAHVAALLTAAVAGALNVVALQQGDVRTPVLVAAGDLRAGATLDDTAVRTAMVSADSSVLDALIGGDRLSERRGWLLTRPVRSGEPLRWTDLRDPAARDGLRAMSLPVEPEHAAGGTLRAGDRVDVIGVREGQAFWVLSDVEVLDAVDRAAEGALAAPRPYALTLAVTEEQALRLAWALHDGAVEVLRSTGAPEITRGQLVLGGPPGTPAAGPTAESRP